MKSIKLFIYPLLAMVLIFANSCKKSYLETNPTDQLGANELFKTTTSAYTALNGLHSYLIARGGSTINGGLDTDFGIMSTDIIDDLMGNDMIQHSSPYQDFRYYYRYIMSGNGSSTYYGTYTLWYFFYKVINNANNIIVNIDNAEGPDDEKNDIKGQALAYRAWALFKLASYYQYNYYIDNASTSAQHGDPNTAPGVPIYLIPTEGTTQGNGRGTLQQDYDQILSDIQQSVDLLANAKTHTEISNISLAAAQGIYARIALQIGDYAKARQMAILAYASHPLMNAGELTGGFNSSNNQEWIWGSTHTSEQYDGANIGTFISYMDPTTVGYAAVGAGFQITKALYDQIDDADVRKAWWGGDQFPTKFRAKSTSSFDADAVYMRSSEMYLIEAEAECRLGLVDLAKSTLEQLMIIRDPNYVAPSTQAELLDEILLQRRIELWGEGFAFSDIKRMRLKLQRPIGTGNHSQANAGGVLNLNPNDPTLLYKIPQRELETNPNIDESDQNP